MKSTVDWNIAELVGILVKPFEFAEKNMKNTIYTGVLATIRDSGKADEIPLAIDEKLLETLDDSSLEGKWVSIKGYVYGRTINTKMRTGVYVEEISVVEENSHFRNFIKVSGEIASEIKLRNNEIVVADFILASTTRGETQYIPVIAWAHQAYAVKNMFKPHSPLRIKGRFQSRTFHKFYPDGKEKYRRKVFEVSIRKFKPGRPLLEKEN